MLEEVAKLWYEIRPAVGLVMVIGAAIAWVATGQVWDAEARGDLHNPLNWRMGGPLLRRPKRRGGVPEAYSKQVVSQAIFRR